VIVEPAGIAAFGVVSALAALRGMGHWSMVIGTYASAGLQVALSWTLAGWRPRLGLASFGTWLELARFSRHLFVAGLLRSVSSELPAAIVGRYLGADALGQYRYGERFGTQPQSAVTNVAAYVLLPAFARIATDAERLRRAFLRALRWVALVAVPVGFILLPLGQPLIVLLLGPRWHEAGYVVMAFFAYTAGSAVVQVAVEAFKVVDRPDLIPRIRGLSAVLTAIGVVVGVLFGTAAVAAGVSLATLAVAVYAAGAARRIIGVALRAVWAQIWPATAAAVVMAAALWALDRLALDAGSRSPAIAAVLLAVEGAVGAAVYVGALLVVAPAVGGEVVAALRAGGRRLVRGRRAGPLTTPGGV
jgi:PST family polysaccharide transporter